MAKYEARLRGDLRVIADTIHSEILNGSSSASHEDGSVFSANGVSSCVNVYERFSYTGSNRVSLAVTLFANGDDISLSAITAGGSQALWFKINTLGEGAFLDKLIQAVAPFVV